MRDEDASVASGENQDGGIFETSEPCGCSGSEIDRRDAPHDCRDDDLIEISIRLKADRHQRVMGVCFLASASFW